MVTVLLANGIQFIQENGRLPSISNTLSKNIEILNGITYDYNHIFIDTDTPIIQVLSSITESVSMTLIKEDGSESAVAAVVVKEFASSDRRYTEFTLDLSAIDQCFYLKVSSTAVDEPDWISEDCIVTEYEKTMLRLEWYSETNDFDVYYGNGITFFMWIEDNLYNGYAPAGRDSVFDNDYEIVKIESVLYRTLALKIGELPPSIAEKVALACKQKKLYVNEVEYTTEENLDITNLEFTNLNDGEIVLTQTNVIGLNTHKIGFNIADIMAADIIAFGGASLDGSDQFDFLEGYLVHVIQMYLTDGALATVKLGITPGGAEIATKILTSADPKLSVPIHSEMQEAGIGTIYYTITGTGAKVSIYGHSINNR